MARDFFTDQSNQPKEYFVYFEDDLSRAGEKVPAAAAGDFMELAPTKVKL